MESNPSFSKFQLTFWLIAGTVLLISGTTHTDFITALVRNVYLAIAGYAVGSLFHRYLAAGLRNDFAQDAGIACLFSLVLGLAVVGLINPVSYTMEGRDYWLLPLTAKFAGGLNYAFVLFIWCLLYMFLVVRREPDAQAMPEHPHCKPTTIEVDQGKTKTQIAAQDVLYLKAAGDYVNLVTAKQTFLKKATLASLTESLTDVGLDMERIHRSVAVNMDCVQGYEACHKGSYHVVMENGDRLSSGRTYKQRLDARFSANL